MNEQEREETLKLVERLRNYYASEEGSQLIFDAADLLERLANEEQLPVKYFQLGGKGLIHAVYGSSSISFVEELLEHLARSTAPAVSAEPVAWVTKDMTYDFGTGSGEMPVSLTKNRTWNVPLYLHPDPKVAELRKEFDRYREAFAASNETHDNLVAELEAKNAALLKDAERYRFAKHRPSMWLHCADERLDAAIDAAIAKETKGD